jgi:hypothetical protein
MARTTPKDSFATLLAQIRKIPPLAALDPDFLRHELDRIKRRELDEAAIAKACRALLDMLPSTNPIFEALETQHAHWSYLAERRKAGGKFFRQCEILQVLQWPGATIAAINPVFRAACVVVFGEEPSERHARKIIKHYRDRHHVVISGAMIIKSPGTRRPITPDAVVVRPRKSKGHF